MKPLRRLIRVKCYLLAVTLVALSSAGSGQAQSDWAATLYLGKLTDARLDEIVTNDFDFEKAYHVGLGVMRRVYSYQHYFDLELEGRVNTFFGDQDNWEFGLLGYFRWLPFPWDRYLDTSFAAAAGLSYATAIPEIEIKHHDKSALILGTLSFEFAFALPAYPEWNLVAGVIHHRSGAAGTFSGVKSAANGLGIGIRYRFQ